MALIHGDRRSPIFGVQDLRGFCVASSSTGSGGDSWSLAGRTLGGGGSSSGTGLVGGGSTGARSMLEGGVIPGAEFAGVGGSQPAVGTMVVVSWGLSCEFSGVGVVMMMSGDVGRATSVEDVSRTGPAVSSTGPGSVIGISSGPRVTGPDGDLFPSSVSQSHLLEAEVASNSPPPHECISSRTSAIPETRSDIPA